MCSVHPLQLFNTLLGQKVFSLEYTSPSSHPPSPFPAFPPSLLPTLTLTLTPSHPLSHPHSLSPSLSLTNPSCAMAGNTVACLERNRQIFHHTSGERFSLTLLEVNPSCAFDPSSLPSLSTTLPPSLPPSLPPFTPSLSSEGTGYHGSRNS